MHILGQVTYNIITDISKFDKNKKKRYNVKGQLKEEFMIKQKLKSVSYKKIIAISIIFVIILGISVIAGNTKINSVKIKFQITMKLQ